MDSQMSELKVSKRDGVFSIVYCVYAFVWMNVVIYTIRAPMYTLINDLIQNHHLAVLSIYLFSMSILLLPLALYVNFKDLQLKSIGKGSLYWYSSCVLGLRACFILLIVLFFKVPGAISSILELKFEGFALTLIGLLVISIGEEVVFRAFLPAKMKELIPQKTLRTLIIGLVFAMCHAANFGLYALNFANIVKIIEYIVLHVIFTYLYDAHKNLAAPVMFHTLFNLLVLLAAD